MAVASKQQETRQALLDAGISIMLEKGYSNTGISEILSAVGVPKGSFYYYFDSKEDFALAMIEHASELYDQQMTAIFGDLKRKPIERLKNYFVDGQKDMVDKKCRKGCLIGNLSQEMADQSERLRSALTEVLQAKQAVLASCIAEAQADGEILSSRPALELSQLSQMAWMGAMLMAKAAKDPTSLNTCANLIFQDILKERAS